MFSLHCLFDPNRDHHRRHGLRHTSLAWLPSVILLSLLGLTALHHPIRLIYILILSLPVLRHLHNLPCFCLSQTMLYAYDFEPFKSSSRLAWIVLNVNCISCVAVSRFTTISIPVTTVMTKATEYHLATIPTIIPRQAFLDFPIASSYQGCRLLDLEAHNGCNITDNPSSIRHQGP